MSTLVYDQDYYEENIPSKFAVAEWLEEAAREIRKDGVKEVKIYLGGTVYAHIDLDEMPGVTIEA